MNNNENVSIKNNFSPSQLKKFLAMNKKFGESPTTINNNDKLSILDHIKI